MADPALRQPVRHQGVEGERRRDGRALEVARLAGGVLGDRRHRHVEARQPRQAAEHEEGKAQVVERRADAEREGDRGGGDAKGDLKFEGLAHEVRYGCFRLKEVGREGLKERLHREGELKYAWMGYACMAFGRMYPLTYQVSERIQLLAHQAALSSPAGHFAVEEVKEETEGQKEKGRPKVAVL